MQRFPACLRALATVLWLGSVGEIAHGITIRRDSAVPAAAAPPRNISTPPAPVRAPRSRISAEQCRELEQAIVAEPKASCKTGLFASKYDGCVCTLKLPNSVNPLPNTLFDPVPDGMKPDPSIPTSPPLPPLPLPRSSGQLYKPPIKMAACPFEKNCTASFSARNNNSECVGFDSWGFSEVYNADYAPASGYLNMITCSYIMQPDGRFAVPSRVAFMWDAQKKRAAALNRYNETVSMTCGGRPIDASWGNMCNSTMQHPDVKCTMRWSEFFGSRCENSFPPYGFSLDSTFGEFCPKECRSVFGN